MDSDEIHTPWDDIELVVEITGHSWAHSRMDVPMEIAPPTDEERARRYAHRSFDVTPEMAWQYGICIDCGLPLAWHPRRRRKRSRRRYCQVARRGTATR